AARPIAAAAIAHGVDGVDDVGGGRRRREPRQERKPPEAASGAQGGHCSSMTTAGWDAEQFTTTGWPWRTGNSFRLLDGGSEFFPRMLAAIDAASESVLLEMYLVRSSVIATRFFAALAEAVRRGARVCVIFDGFGALGLARADRRRLLQAGVEL